MTDESNAPAPWPDLIERIRARTPARVLTARAGPAYRSATQLELRRAHAAARDAVRTELDLNRDLGAELVHTWKIFLVNSVATSKEEYLRRPGLGRQLNAGSREEVKARCISGPDLQIVIGDGLSVSAISSQVPGLFPLLLQRAHAHGWKVGQTFAVRYCRVGIMNGIGELLRPKVLVLLIGERPGLSTAESLSAYMAFEPQASHNDSNRNLVSNIHRRGIEIGAAASRIIALAEHMMERRTSGVKLKEELPQASWLLTGGL